VDKGWWAKLAGAILTLASALVAVRARIRSRNAARLLRGETGFHLLGTTLDAFHEQLERDAASRERDIGNTALLLLLGAFPGVCLLLWSIAEDPIQRRWSLYALVFSTAIGVLALPALKRDAIRFRAWLRTLEDEAGVAFVSPSSGTVYLGARKVVLGGKVFRAQDLELELHPTSTGEALRATLPMYYDPVFKVWGPKILTDAELPSPLSPEDRARLVALTQTPSRKV
jgi:hypothetical protein